MKCLTLGGIPGPWRSLCNSNDKYYGAGVDLELDQQTAIHLPGL